MNNKIILIEGPRNCGKTYLIDYAKSNLLNINTYKFPFVKFYSDLYSGNNNDENLFYLTFGYDLTLFDLVKKGLLKDNLIIDRSILSDIVFAIQANRISESTAKLYLNWIMNEYGDILDIIFIDADVSTDNRNKDEWVHYNIDETRCIYLSLIKELNITKFKNELNINSAEQFLNIIKTKMI